MSGIINESTTIIQLNTAGLQGSTIVYVSSTAIPGQLVTVTDATGFLSSPQSISLSTVGSATLDAGAFIQQRYGYVSLVSQDTNTWVPVNCNSFPTTAPIYYRALDAPLIETSTLGSYGCISSVNARTTGTDAIVAQATHAFLSSANINSYQPYLSTSTTDPRLRIWGDTKVYGSTNTIGTLNIRGLISTSGRLNVGGNVSSKLGTIYVGGNLTTLGSVRGQRGNQITAAALSSFGSAAFNLAVNIASNTTASFVSTNSATTVLTIGNFLNATSSIVFGPGRTIEYRRGGLNFLGTSMTTPSISSASVTSSNAVSAYDVTFQSFGPASTLRSFAISSAQIVNANGSLATSSISGSAITVAELASSRIETKNDLTATTLTMNDVSYSGSTNVVYPPFSSNILGTMTIPMYWSISSTGTNGTLYAPGNISTNILSTDLILTDRLVSVHETLTNFRANSMTVSDTIFFSSATLLSLKDVYINNIGGSLKGARTKIASDIQISSIQTDIILSPNIIQFYGNSTFSISTAIVSSLTSQTILTSSFAFTNGNLGGPMNYSTINPSTPWLQISTVNPSAPPFTTTSGLGTYFDEINFTAATDQTAYYSMINPLAQPSFLSTPYINTVAGRGSKGWTGDGGPASNASIGYIVSQPAVDSQGSVYFGANEIGWGLRKIITGQITTIAGNYQFFYGDGRFPTAAALGPKLAVSVVSPGTILVTDASNVRLRYVDQTPIIYTIAGSGQPGYSGDGATLSASFRNPNMTVADATGNIFIADTSNNMIRKLAASTITRYAGDTTAGATGDGGQALSARLAAPYGLAIDSANLLYITDTSNCVVRTVDAGTGVIQRFAGNYTQGFTGDGGAATSATLSYPRGIVADPAKNIYLCDTGNKRIRRVDFMSGIISTIAGNGVEGFAGDGGPGYLAALSSPTGVTTDNAGNLYIADTNNNCIRFLNAQTGIITTVVGRPPLAGYSGNNTFATTALLSSPSHVAFDQSTGYYYISDDGNRRVRLVNSATGIIYDYVGNGSPFSLADKLPASNAVFGSIGGLATDLENNIYVADSAANGIRKIDFVTGTISSVVGTATGGFTGDGAGITAAISTPHTILTDNDNNLIFCDTNNHRVRKYLSTTKSVVTLAGTGVGGYGGDEGDAATATLNFPKALTLDRSGNIFIGDSSNYRIRRIDAATGIITTYAGTGTAGTISAGGSAVSTQLGVVTALTTEQDIVYFTDTPTNGLWQIQTDGTLQPMNTVSTASYLGDGGPLTTAQFNAPMGAFADTSGNFIICDSGNFRLRRTYTYGIPQTPVYLNMYLTFTNYFATSGTTNVFVNGNNIASFNTSSINSTISITDTNIFNYPMQNSNPLLGDQTPYIEIRQLGNIGYIKFEGNLWVNQVPGQGLLQDSVNNTAGIIMNSGILQFPYANNGITIQNKYNDASMRTLRYTGNLNNASDPALKEQIEPASLQICYQTLEALPLRTYNYIPAYESTFHVHDSTRMGFLTSEVAHYFPRSITTIPFEHAWAPQTINTLDLAQIKYAHLGATQELIQQVSSLEAAVAQLDLVRKILRFKATQRNVIL